MSEGKPTITKAQEKKPEPKELSRFQKRRADRALKKKQKEKARKAKATKAAKGRKSYLDAISSKGTSAEVKQKTKAKTASKSKAKNKKRSYKPSLSAKKAFKNKRVLLAGAGVLAIIVAIGVLSLRPSGGQVSSTNTETGVDGVVSSELPPLEPEFSLLFPVGFSPDDYDVRQTNPPGHEPTYTYLDRVKDDGAIVQVTQQRVPASFSLVDVATNFQATNVIQIDEMIVYHGRNERDNVQSLVFVKDDLLVTIRSPESYLDDVWAGYIISLQ